MNAERKAVESEYQKAINRMNSAMTEESYESASADVARLRKLVIELEAKYPTSQERRRQSRKEWMIKTGQYN